MSGSCHHTTAHFFRLVKSALPEATIDLRRARHSGPLRILGTARAILWRNERTAEEQPQHCALVPYVLPSSMIEVREYLDAGGVRTRLGSSD